MFSNFESVDNMEKRKIQFCQNFGMFNYEKTMLVNNFTVLFLHVLSRVAHVSEVCINAIPLSAKKVLSKI